MDNAIVLLLEADGIDASLALVSVPSLTTFLLPNANFLCLAVPAAFALSAFSISLMIC